MKILITGAKGFVGKNLVAELKNQGYNDLLLCDRNTTEAELEQFALETDFVYHLAGVNRPKKITDFESGNKGFTEKLIKLLSENKTSPPMVFASSTQAELLNAYGTSKKEAENLVISYSQEKATRVMIYRFPNLFGKWSKPNYNSVIATFCHNISRDIPIQVNDNSSELTLAYIDDIVNELILQIEKQDMKRDIYCEIHPTYKVSLGNLVAILKSFKESRSDLTVPKLDEGLTKKLYSTYLSYLPENQFSYELKMHKDDRGSFTEFIRTPDRGQVSVNISKPQITKGNHWHHTKNEKFLVVSGRGVIRFRNIDSNEVIEYFVSSEELKVVDIPVGYTHNIQNLGDTDMVTIMWVNEQFNPEKPDTYYMEV